MAMKPYIHALIAFVFFLLPVSSIDAKRKDARFVTTIQPIASIVANIVGETGSVKRLLPAGASPHSYDPRPSDLMAAKDATALIYVARTLDGWAAKLDAPEKIELLSLVPKAYLIHADAHHDEHGHGHDHGEIDPHFWGDPLAVKAMLPNLVESLCRLDKKRCPSYKKNADTYKKKLDALHERVKKSLAKKKGAKLLLSHPFFRYFFARYELSLLGVVSPTPGKEPTPKAIVRMVRLVKKEGVKHILSMNQHSMAAAKAVSEAAGIDIVLLDPLGGVAGRMRYEEIISYNLKKIIEALK